MICACSLGGFPTSGFWLRVWFLPQRPTAGAESSGGLGAEPPVQLAAKRPRKQRPRDAAGPRLTSQRQRCRLTDSAPAARSGATSRGCGGRALRAAFVAATRRRGATNAGLSRGPLALLEAALLRLVLTQVPACEVCVPESSRGDHQLPARNPMRIALLPSTLTGGRCDPVSPNRRTRRPSLPAKEDVCTLVAIAGAVLRLGLSLHKQVERSEP